MTWLLHLNPELQPRSINPYDYLVEASLAISSRTTSMMDALRYLTAPVLLAWANIRDSTYSKI